MVAFAFEEGNHHNPGSITTTADKGTEGYTLTGTKTFVLDGHIADKFVVAAKTANGPELFVVDANAKGVTAERNIFMDSRNVTTVNFDKVIVSSAAILNEYENGKALLNRTLDIARVGLALSLIHI